MTIYFINKSCSITQPCNIRDYRGVNPLKVGDICIRDTDANMCALFVTDLQANWDANTIIGRTVKRPPFGSSNTLLYSFDGISKRLGSIDRLNSLIGIFDNAFIDKLLQQSVEILKYERDYIDADVFKGLLMSKTKDFVMVPTLTNKTSIPIFFDFFSGKAKELLFQLYGDDNALKKVYEMVRSKYPKDYSDAFKQFSKAYPEHNIYDFHSENTTILNSSIIELQNSVKQAIVEQVLPIVRKAQDVGDFNLLFEDGDITINIISHKRSK